MNPARSKCHQPGFHPPPGAPRTRTRKMRFFGLPPLRRILLLVLLGGGAIGWTVSKSPIRWMLHPRISDELGILGKDLRTRNEEQLQSLFDESGVDIRFLLVPTTGSETVEQFAVRRARELGVGRETDRRGVLIVYDRRRQSMRIEVGPNLQGILPDRFIGFLVREHARAFFEDGNPELGLRLLVRLIHWRIREAQLGEEYDPAFEEYVEEVRRLATGGGASGKMGLTSRPANRVRETIDRADSIRFGPQPTVAAAHRRFLEWLALEQDLAKVPLFTPSSQNHIAANRLSHAYRSSWLALEYGKPSAIDERGDRAMLYFTGTPFVSPHFFRRTPEGWQLDLMGELGNTLEAIGGWYSWILVDSGDEYSRAFADRYLPFDDAGFGTYYRVAGGDNRRIATRGGGPAARLELDGVEHLTVYQAASRIAAASNHPSVVVLYATNLEYRRDDFPGLVALAEFCSANGIELLAFSIDGDDALVAGLPAFLASKKAPFPATHIYRWRTGLMASSLSRFGIEIGREWTAPLVAVRDRAGKVVVQGQDVRDWDAVLAAARSTLH